MRQGESEVHGGPSACGGTQKLTFTFFSIDVVLKKTKQKGKGTFNKAPFYCTSTACLCASTVVSTTQSCMCTSRNWCGTCCSTDWVTTARAYTPQVLPHVAMGHWSLRIYLEARCSTGHTTGLFCNLSIPWSGMLHLHFWAGNFVFVQWKCHLLHLQGASLPLHYMQRSFEKVWPFAKFVVLQLCRCTPHLPTNVVVRRFKKVLSLEQRLLSLTLRDVLYAVLSWRVVVKLTSWEIPFENLLWVLCGARNAVLPEFSARSERQK